MTDSTAFKHLRGHTIALGQMWKIAFDTSGAAKLNCFLMAPFNAGITEISMLFYSYLEVFDFEAIEITSMEQWLNVGWQLLALADGPQGDA